MASHGMAITNSRTNSISTKESDDHSVEIWEHIALILAARAGMDVATHELRMVDGRHVLILWRFDRKQQQRIPFLSAMTLLQAKDGDRTSYPEVVDELSRHGGNTRMDSMELFRPMVFNILVSNVDDHLRNHGFLWAGMHGWVLSPAYDLNPTPTDLKARILSTNISLDEGACSIDLALSQAELFGLSLVSARRIVDEVGQAVARWSDVSRALGQNRREIERMESAFEHADLVMASKMLT